ncbi:hypothetical protein [Peterkaempfera bronchialis]|uniref:Uncharacterized protein n=1 Tax=Peterkaempfera bronchialis TaxID=2126346 RepID=A0A345SYF6_9ACTN|nr:hypothetical protein [Peterkaempfera bronchialis]AXI78761.1 hypothetical protein C7M71_016375 [Peterkaempfera bronchialis]
MSRVTASITAVVLAAAPALFFSAPAPASAAVTVQQVRASDLGPGRPWIRLEDDPSNVGKTPGIERVAPFADPVRFNGSLHLAVGPGEQSQAAHYFSQKIPLGTIAATRLSYDSFVDSAKSTATGTAANLQLPMTCQGAFTTISFQPQLATDSQGRSGVVPDTWQNFVSSGSSLWRTSRAVPTVPSLPAGADAPLSAYVAACTAPGDGVLGVIGNVGRLGDPTATLDTYVDNLTVHGVVYDFAVQPLAQGHIGLANTTPGRPCRSANGTIVFTDPTTGPFYRSVGTRLVFSQGRRLRPGDLTVTANGRPVTLTPGPDNTLTAVLAPAPARDLAPGGTYLTPFTVSFAHGVYSEGGQGGALIVTAELLARGYVPLQETGVLARTRLRG